MLAALGLVTSLSASRAGAQQTCQVGGTESDPKCYSQNPADWPAPARPYFMVVFDVSGSMNQCTTPPSDFPASCSATPTAASPNNTCGLRPTRMNDGKCALRKMVHGFSQVDFGLTTFLQTIQACTGTKTCTPYNVNGFMPEYYADTCEVRASCQAGTGMNATGGIVRVPVVASSVGSMLKWVDDDCTDGQEVLPAGATPINGALRDAARHLRDSDNVTRLGPGCRPVNVILITDGGESCDPQPDPDIPDDQTPVLLNRARFSAQDLYNVGLGDASGRHVKVYPIGFGGVTANEQNALNAIAEMGQCGVDAAYCGANTCTAAQIQCVAAVSALIASNEAQLSQSLAAIIAGAIQPEECDNKDNNCNGCVDEGYRHYCNQGQAAGDCCAWNGNLAAREACLVAYRNSLPTGDPKLLPCATPTESQNCATWLCFNPGDKCDNVDNNCNGATDENQLKCNGQCPLPEKCDDGLDNDCNGQVDELESCTKCVPSAEICDGCDNDCDGTADEGVEPLACGLPSPPAQSYCAGERICAEKQVPTIGGCVSGVPFWGECSDNPGTETCDKLDNDCDGTADEDLPAEACDVPNTTGLSYGAPSQCRRGLKPCNGTCAGYVGPSVEICDGIDNNCNGLVDDGLTGLGADCGNAVLPCTQGKTACQFGVIVCLGGTKPQPEECDNIDNDCNGFVDDGALLDSPAVKDCWDRWIDSCASPCTYETEKWCPPEGATCTGLGSLVDPCALGSLTCKAGVWQCQGGRLPDNEVCDGVDNNCNSGVDEGFVETSCGTDVGECIAGTQKCENGTVVCKDATGPKTEECNGKDDDCDGVNDNGISIGTSCFPTFDTTLYPVPPKREAGECKPGVTECDANGQQVCKGGVGPSPEICDGKDNDCDGQIDEVGNAPDGINGTADPADPTKTVGAECGIDEGECSKGTWSCAAGHFVCQGGSAAQPEVCDCKDNDCDGQIDEDPVAGSGEPDLCSTGKTCVEYAATCQCAAPCGGGEFPCPTGGFSCQTVDKSGTEPPETAGKRCVTDPCLGGCSTKKVEANGKIECAPAGTPGQDGGTAPPVCQCKGASGCHNPCFGVTCTDNQVCSDYGPNAGKCVVDNCFNVPCPTGKACNNGTCVTNPCKADSCKAGEVCKPSADFNKPECFGSCAGITCKSNEQCIAGKCQPTGCAQECPDGQVCSGGDAGTCIKSKCDPNPCTNGSWCNPATGSCGNDPCAGVLCPTNQTCDNGQCITAAVVDAGPDAKDSGKGGSGGSAGAAGGAGTANAGNAGSDDEPDKGKYGLATGGGGCACKVSSTSSTEKSAGFAALIGVALLAARRRRRLRDDQSCSGKSDACSSLCGRGGAR